MLIEIIRFVLYFEVTTILLNFIPVNYTAKELVGPIPEAKSDRGAASSWR
jgi:hypothetical protein